MALKIDKLTETGVIASYWAIKSFSLVKSSNEPDGVNINYRVFGFYNEDARKSGAKPLQELSFLIKGNPLDSHLVNFPYIELRFDNDNLSVSVSNYDTTLTPNYVVPLKAVCQQISTWCYLKAKEGMFVDAVDILE